MRLHCGGAGLLAGTKRFERVTDWLKTFSYALAGLILLAGGCSPPADSPSSPPQRAPSEDQSDAHHTELMGLIRQRLELMPGVAQAKWNRELPITDPKREAALLTRLTADGLA